MERLALSPRDLVAKERNVLDRGAYVKGKRIHKKAGKKLRTTQSQAEGSRSAGVLVIDDDAYVLDAVSKYLAGAGLDEPGCQFSRRDA